MSYKNNMMSVAIAVLLASTTLSAAKANNAEALAAVAVSADTVMDEDKS